MVLQSSSTLFTRIFLAHHPYYYLHPPHVCTLRHYMDQFLCRPCDEKKINYWTIFHRSPTLSLKPRHSSALGLSKSRTLAVIGSRSVGRTPQFKPHETFTSFYDDRGSPSVLGATLFLPASGLYEQQKWLVKIKHQMKVVDLVFFCIRSVFIDSWPFPRACCSGIQRPGCCFWVEIPTGNTREHVPRLNCSGF